MRVLRWLVPDRRSVPRHLMPPLVSYVGVPGMGKPCNVGDVSASGFYMLTRDRWDPGTFLPVSLKRTDLFGARCGDFITVQALVVRNGTDGVGFAFLLGDDEEEGPNALAGAHWVTKRRMAEFLVGLRQSEAEDAEATTSAT